MQETWKTELTAAEKADELERVIQLCHANLFNGKSEVLDYLRGRGVYDTTSRIFKLGVFPQDPNVLVRFVGKDALFKCGIISIDKESIACHIAKRKESIKTAAQLLLKFCMAINLLRNGLLKKLLI